MASEKPVLSVKQGLRVNLSRVFGRIFSRSSDLPASGFDRARWGNKLRDRDHYYRQAGKALLPGKRILLLEDNEACSEILRNCMGRWEMEVTVAATCRDAMRIAAAGSHYDFGVFDHTLPDGTGDDVVRYFQQRDAQSFAVLVSLTGNRFLPDKTLYDSTLEKPITPESLREKLIDLLLAERTGLIGGLIPVG